MEFVDQYSYISRDYNLGPYQNLKYLYNLLHRYAERVYLDKDDKYATSFQQDVALFED